MQDEFGSISKPGKDSGPQSWGPAKWHAEAAKIYPPATEDFKNIEKLIDDYILPGHSPPSPLIDRESGVVTIGSCFAAELRYFLSRFGVSSGSFWVPSGLNNSFAILDFLQWCVYGKESDGAYRYDRAEDGDIEEWKPVQAQKDYLQHIASADLFVFTLGLSEVWRHKETLEVFWRGVPDSIFDNNLHTFEVSSVAENKDNLHGIVECIRFANKKAPIVLTLSPVPLKATFREISCMTADAVSKSILRVAINELMAEKIDNVYYFPSYEIVKWAGGHLSFPAFGLDDGCVRHVSRFLVINIINSFIKHYAQRNFYEMFKAKMLAEGLDPSRERIFAIKR